MKKLKNTKSIEDVAIQYVVDYLREHEKIKNPTIVKRGVDVIAGRKLIEVKGCLKQETNIRVVPQTLDYAAEKGRLKDFYIYYVFDISSKKPKLMIFDYRTFKKHKVIEIKYIIQPRRIKRETGKPEIIELK